MKDDSRLIYDYNAWANSIVFDHLVSLPPHIYEQQLTSVFPTISDALKHIYIIDHGWYSVLSGQYGSDDYKAIGESVTKLIMECKDDTLEDLKVKMRSLAKKFMDFIDQNDMEHVQSFAGVSMRYSDVIQHIVNHGIYHRGNITAMVRQLGFKGTPTDYGLFLYRQQNKL